MKFLVLLILLPIVLGFVPNNGWPWELRKVEACRTGRLFPHCKGGTVIQFYNSTFQLSIDNVNCNPHSTYCDITTQINPAYHQEIRDSCVGKQYCSVRVGYGYLQDSCTHAVSDVVRIIYCCVSYPSVPCIDLETTSAPSTSSLPTSTTVPPWVTPNTTLSSTTPSTTYFPPSKDNTALIAGIVGGFGGAAISASVIVLIVMKYKPKSKRTKNREAQSNTLPAVTVEPPGVQTAYNGSMKTPDVYYVKPLQDQDSHHYQSIDWTPPPYYNVYNHYENIDYSDSSLNEPREQRDNDSQYEEVGGSYYAYGTSTT